MQSDNNGGKSFVGTFFFISFTTFLVFLALRLTGVIDWNLFFIFLPMIIFGGVMLIVIILGLIIGILSLCIVNKALGYDEIKDILKEIEEDDDVD